MSEADKLFEELGYEKYDGNNNIEFYKYLDGLLTNDALVIIRFYTKDMEVWKNAKMSTQELKAIYKKCEELGWI